MTFRSMTLPLFALVAVLAGCTAETGAGVGAASADDARSTASAAQADEGADGNADRGARVHRNHVRPGGPDFLVHAALHAPIDLTAEQRATIEGLASSALPAHRFDASKAKELAAAIRNNAVDTLKPPSAPEADRSARTAESAKALATLHATLTPAQRVALVDSLSKQMSERGSKFHERDGAREGTRDESARSARDDARTRGHRASERGAPGFAGRGFGGPGAPMHMLEGLDLSAEQKETIRAKLEANRPAKPTAEQREQMQAKFASMRAEMQAKLESFKGNDFDAAAFVAPPKSLERPAMTEPANPLAVITSVLTPAQREQLAARIEQGPQKAPRANVQRRGTAK